MKNIIISAVTALLVSVIVVALVGGNQSVPQVSLGGATNYDELTLQDTGTTTLKILGGSTTTGGCIEANATSSATRVALTLVAQATTTNAVSYNGFALWKYGTCE